MVSCMGDRVEAMKVKEYQNSVHKDMAQSQISCDCTEHCWLVANNFIKDNGNMQIAVSPKYLYEEYSITLWMVSILQELCELQ